MLLWHRLGIAGIIALALAFLGAYMVVVSQNPAAISSEANYGPVTP